MPEIRHAGRVDPRRLLPVLVPLAVLGLVLAVGSHVAGRLGVEASAAPDPEPHSPQVAREVLAAWDGRRARAWAAGDAEALRDLYASGSGAGRADVALLKRWTERDLTVVDMQTQVISLAVVEHGADRLVLDVTDRVVGARAVGGGGTRELPRGAPATRRIEMVRSNGEWLVADVSLRPGQPPTPR